MSAPSDAMPEGALEREAAPLAPTRPFYWSVRRELWENRSVYVAPLLASGVVLFGILLSKINPPHLMRSVRTGAVVTREPLIIPAEIHFLIAAAVIIVTTIVVGVFYSLGALHGERRDRTILFWKSLPVSDLTTVLSKAAIPAVVLPLVAFVCVCVTQLIMLVMNMVVLPPGVSTIGALMSEVPLLKILGLEAYSLVAFSLWWAPIWGWLLVVSAWAKRAPFLWAVGPPMALAVIERLSLSTTYVNLLMRYRLMTGLSEAFVVQPDHHEMRLPTPDPLGFLMTPGLWVGLAFAAAFLAAAVWLRRRREPL